MRCGLLELGDASRRAHDERLGKPGFGAALGERAQVTGDTRAEIRVDRGRRGAFVLAKLGRDLVRADDVDVR